MKKTINLSLLLLLSLTLLAQKKKHLVFLNMNYNIPIENSIYIDFDEPDYEIWGEPKNTLSFGFGYTYNLTTYLGVGVQFETEKIEVEDEYLGKFTAKRIAYGIHFLTSYPQTPFHGVGGGYFNLGSANSDDFDNQVNGMEYGLFLGPAFTISDFEIAWLFRPKFTYYFAGDKKAPDSGLITYPGLALKVDYRF